MKRTNIEVIERNPEFDRWVEEHFVCSWSKSISTIFYAFVPDIYRALFKQWVIYTKNKQEDEKKDDEND